MENKIELPKNVRVLISILSLSQEEVLKLRDKLFEKDNNLLVTNMKIRVKEKRDDILILELVE